MLPIAAESLVDVSIPLIGGLAGALAIVGMLLLLPLCVAQRREIMRLLEWQERDPHAGDLDPDGTRAAAPVTGSMSAAAERVTSERPVLERIGTAERAAIELEQAPLWRRIVTRGPRHPLVVSLLALLVGAAIFVAVALLLRAGDDERQGRGFEASSVEVVVLNASSSTGLAGDVADDVEAANFIVAGTTAASDTAPDSVVRYADGAKKEGRAVARRLEIRDLQGFDREAEAAANGAPVVVIVGEDLARAPSGRE